MSGVEEDHNVCCQLTIGVNRIFKKTFQYGQSQIQVGLIGILGKYLMKTS